MKFNTKVIHGGQHHEKVTGAVMPPVFQTSTYAQTSPGKRHQPDGCAVLQFGDVLGLRQRALLGFGIA